MCEHVPQTSIPVMGRDGPEQVPVTATEECEECGSGIRVDAEGIAYESEPGGFWSRHTCYGGRQ